MCRLTVLLLQFCETRRWAEKLSSCLSAQACPRSHHSELHRPQERRTLQPRAQKGSVLGGAIR